MVDRYEALERFSQLRDDGVISEEEFAAEKTKLLGVETSTPSRPSEDTLRPARNVSINESRSTVLLWTVAAVLVLGLLLLFGPRQQETPSAPASSTANAAVYHLPACDSTDARDLLRKAIAEIGQNLIAVNEVSELAAASTQVRQCAADLTIANIGVMRRSFKLLPANDSVSYRAELVGSIAPTATSPAPDNAAAAANGNAASIEEPDEDHYQPPPPATRSIQITDDGKSYACCLTMRDVMRFFSNDGASYTINRSADVELQLDVVDPRGRWNGWTSFSLQFVDVEDESDNVVLWKIVRSGQTLANSDNPPGPANPNTLLRGSFDLHTTSSDDR